MAQSNRVLSEAWKPCTQFLDRLLVTETFSGLVEEENCAEDFEELGWLVCFVGLRTRLARRAETK